MKKIQIIIDNKRLKQNYDYYKNNDIVICVVKSNAYGSNIEIMVKKLINIGASYFAVFNLKEAQKIRKISKNCFILVLNSIEKKDLFLVKKLNLTASINSMKDYYLLRKEKIPVHIKIDTGMHRFGLSPKQFKKVIKDKKLNVTGIFSHLIGGINYLKEIKQQIDLFDSLIKNIDTSKYIIHICSTSSAKIVKSKYQNAIRIGLGLYGFSTFTKPCIKIKLPLILKRKICKGEYCAYDYSFKAPYNGYLYLVPLGYHNWLLPEFKLKINDFISAGKICMNCLTLYSPNNHKEKVITLNGYDLIKIAKINNVSIYYLLSSLCS